MLRAMDKNDESNTKEPDYQFYVSYDFYKKDNPHFQRSKLYGFDQGTCGGGVLHVDSTQKFVAFLPTLYLLAVKDTKRVLTPQLNHISMRLPPVPLLPQRDSIDPSEFCNASTVQGCERDYCSCTHVLQVALASVVEIVLVDEGSVASIDTIFLSPTRTALNVYPYRVPQAWLTMRTIRSTSTAINFA